MICQMQGRRIRQRLLSGVVKTIMRMVLPHSVPGWSRVLKNVCSFRSRQHKRVSDNSFRIDSDDHEHETTADLEVVEGPNSQLEFPPFLGYLHYPPPHRSKRVFPDVERGRAIRSARITSCGRLGEDPS